MDEMDFESESIDGINVTPLVNLSLVLVLIFMVTSPYFLKTLMNVDLPKAVTSKTEDRENITVSISPTEGFAINEIPIDKKALPIQLDRELEKSGFHFVLIRADERVPHAEIEDLMRLCKKLGVKRIAFATVPKI